MEGQQVDGCETGDKTAKGAPARNWLNRALNYRHILNCKLGISEEIELQIELQIEATIDL